MCIETGQIFDSVKKAAVALGIKTHSNVSRCCMGKTNTCAGMKLRYLK